MHIYIEFSNPCQLHPHSSPPHLSYFCGFYLLNNPLSLISVASICMGVVHPLMVDMPRKTDLKQKQQQTTTQPDSSSLTAITCQQQLDWDLLSPSCIHAGVLAALVLPRQPPLLWGSSSVQRDTDSTSPHSDNQPFHS